MTDTGLFKEEEISFTDRRDKQRAIFRREGDVRKDSGADLPEEGDWLLTHCMCITDVGLDDLCERLLHSLWGTNTTRRSGC